MNYSLFGLTMSGLYLAAKDNKDNREEATNSARSTPRVPVRQTNIGPSFGSCAPAPDPRMRLNSLLTSSPPSRIPIYLPQHLPQHQTQHLQPTYHLPRPNYFECNMDRSHQYPPIASVHTLGPIGAPHSSTSSPRSLPLPLISGVVTRDIRPHTMEGMTSNGPPRSKRVGGSGRMPTSCNICHKRKEKVSHLPVANCIFDILTILCLPV
jgi:hypothetical protein